MSLLVVVALALSSCGEDVDATRKVKLAGMDRFTPTQFAAIEKVYVEGLRLQNRSGSAKIRSPAALDRALRPLLMACGVLDGDEPLQRALRTACADAAVFTRSAYRAVRCSGFDACGEALRTWRSALRGEIGSSRRADRVVRATSLSSACVRVLVTSKATYRGYRFMDSALTRVVRAVESQSTRELSSAVASLRRSGPFADPSTARRDRLSRFRRHCR